MWPVGKSLSHVNGRHEGAAAAVGTAVAVAVGTGAVAATGVVDEAAGCQNRCVLAPGELVGRNHPGAGWKMADSCLRFRQRAPTSLQTFNLTASDPHAITYYRSIVQRATTD